MGPSPARARMRSGSSTMPVGLQGELMSTALVRGVICLATSSGRNWKPSSSWVSVQTGFPPA